MKKLLTFIFAVLISACSTDDNTRVMYEDPIIGIWQPGRTVTVFNDGSESSKAFSPCELNNRITFEADGRFFMTNFPEGDDPNCEEMVGNLFQSGTWTHFAPTVYVIELMCAIPGCDEIEEEVPDEVTFPNDNTMRVKEIDEENADISHFYYFYNRVE